jgi:hypothetical protein
MKKDFKPLITMNLNSMKKNQNKKGGNTAEDRESKKKLNKNSKEQFQIFITDYYYKGDDAILLDLGEMYVSDNKFKTNINKKGNPGTAEFVNSCIKIYVN